MTSELTWTDERAEIARARFIVDGWSAAKVGKLLGVSRNTVIGLANRRGWTRAPTWTPARTDRLKALHAAGKTYGEMAKDLGLGLGAIASKVARLSLQRSAEAGKVARSVSRKPAPSAPVPRVRVVAGEHTNQLRPPVALPMGRADAAPTVYGVENLTRHHCKWPIGEAGDQGQGFCGAHRGDGPYCPAHTARACSGHTLRPLKAPRPDWRTVNKREAEEYVLNRAGLA